MFGWMLASGWIGRGFFRRMVRGAFGSNPSVSCPYAKVEAAMSNAFEDVGVCLIEGIYQLHLPESPEFDVVFFTEKKSSRWVTLDDKTHWPSAWLPDDLARSRVLEVRHSTPNRHVTTFDIAINAINSLKCSNVGLGSRPYFLVSSGVSNVVVAHMAVRGNMRPILSYCMGIAMYGGIGDKCGEDGLRRVLLDYEAFERDMNTVTFLGSADELAGGSRSSNMIRYVDVPKGGDLTRPADKRSPIYAHLVSFIEKSAIPADLGGDDGPSEDAAAPLLMNLIECEVP